MAAAREKMQKERDKRSMDTNWGEDELLNDLKEIRDNTETQEERIKIDKLLKSLEENRKKENIQRKPWLYSIYTVCIFAILSLVFGFLSIIIINEYIQLITYSIFISTLILGLIAVILGRKYISSNSEELGPKEDDTDEVDNALVQMDDAIAEQNAMTIFHLIYKECKYSARTDRGRTVTGILYTGQRARITRNVFNEVKRRIRDEINNILEEKGSGDNSNLMILKNKDGSTRYLNFPSPKAEVFAYQYIPRNKIEILED